MIELHDITINKKGELNRFLHLRQNGAAELSFTNIFMWRKSYDMKYAIVDDMLCTTAAYADDEPRCFSFPIGFTDEFGKERDIRPALTEIIGYFKSRGERPIMRFSSEREVEHLNREFPDMFEIREERDAFDYVYKTEDLIRLSGKKYHAKKNHINKFKKLYPDFEYVSLGKSDGDEVLELFNSWRSNKEVETEGLDDEFDAIKDLVTNIDELGVVGGGIRVGGRLAAFSFGEALDDKMALIHLEHADNAYEGAFTVMNQQFLEHEWSGFEFVNREEDMGIEGMRKAKLSYHPCMMIKKYVAEAKK